MRQLLELGFSLKDSAAALGSCRADSHLLENSVVALLEADALTKFDIGDRLPCPSAEFRGHVTVRALFLLLLFLLLLLLVLLRLLVCSCVVGLTRRTCSAPAITSRRTPRCRRRSGSC